MAERDSPALGEFCWPELSTTDQPAATRFYGSLFGWSVVDQPMGPTEVYSMFQLRGKEVAAAYTMRPEERQQGIPAHWNSYVAVVSADAAAQRAVDLGGRVVMPPMDVFDAGRMAVIQDPAQAVFAVWEAGRHIGARVVDEPDALCWTELTTSDANAAETFYTGLFGWSAETAEVNGQPYTQFGTGDRKVAGMLQIRPEWGPMAPNWAPYFESADPDVTVSRARVLGGQVYMGPMDIPGVGRLAMVADPQGGSFMVFRPARA